MRAKTTLTSSWAIYNYIFLKKKMENRHMNFLRWTSGKTPNQDKALIDGCLKTSKMYLLNLCLISAAVCRFIMYNVNLYCSFCIWIFPNQYVHNNKDNVPTCAELSAAVLQCLVPRLHPGQSQDKPPHSVSEWDVLRSMLCHSVPHGILSFSKHVMIGMNYIH